MKLDDQRRANVMDALIAIALFAASLGSVIAWGGDPDPARRSFDVLAGVLVAGQTLPLIWRRRSPVTVLTIIVLAFIVDRGLEYPLSWALYGIAFAIYTIGSQLPPRRSLLVGGIALDVVLLWTAIGVAVSNVEPIVLATELAVFGFPLLIGRETYQRQQRVIDLERRAIRAEHEREQRANEAVSQERVRIARELHDVVAHEITVMTIQSAAARRILDEDPEKAEVAMRSAEAAGHRALTEVRRLLGMLRTTDPKATQPQPGMGSIDSLVEQMNRAGLATTLTVEGEIRSLPLGVDINAYRIIQEALTNTLKHGGPDVHAEIVVEYGDHLLAIEVRDDGRGAAAATPPEAAPRQGLVGMHERASLLGGALHAGPRPGGGYRVSAKIPIPAL